jgi:hypothetical protein
MNSADLRIGALCTGHGGLDIAVQAVFAGRLVWCVSTTTSTSQPSWLSAIRAFPTKVHKFSYSEGGVWMELKGRCTLLPRMDPSVGPGLGHLHLVAVSDVRR